MENGRKLPATGVILAGGSNRRMGGRMKALLSWNGQLFIERQMTEMSKLCNEILIIANEPSLFEPQLAWPQAHVRIVRDLQPGNGPLAGLQAAMAEAQNDGLWVVACDMPFISAGAAGMLLELRGGSGAGFDAAVPLLHGRLQPLHAVYHRRCRVIINDLLAASEYRMMKLLDGLTYTTADERDFSERGLSLRFAENVNTPDDLEQLKICE